MAKITAFSEEEVVCDGSTDDISPSHPRVYLHVQENNRIECPYCGKMFVHEKKC